MPKEELNTEEIKELRSKFIKSTCCMAYKTERGRCYTCPDFDYCKDTEEMDDDWNDDSFGEEE